MTDLSSGSKLCNNCEQQINLASFLMHETFCLRNIIRCRDCNKPIDKNRQREHDKEFHEQVKCDCGDLVAKSDLVKHRSETCRKRQLKCDYCELTLDADKLKSHTDFCGSRTELCHICGRYIQIKDRDVHTTMDCGSLARAQTDSNVTTVNERRETGRRFIGSASRRGDDNMLPCEFCYEPFPLDQLIVHQAVCTMNTGQDVIDHVDHRFNAFGFQDNHPEPSPPPIYHQTDPESMVPCEFCHKLFDFDFIIIHQSECNLVPSTPRIGSSNDRPSSTTRQNTESRGSASSTNRPSSLTSSSRPPGLSHLRSTGVSKPSSSTSSHSGSKRDPNRK